jgi:hypothetical protein
LWNLPVARNIEAFAGRRSGGLASGLWTVGLMALQGRSEFDMITGVFKTICGASEIAASSARLVLGPGVGEGGLSIIQRSRQARSIKLLGGILGRAECHDPSAFHRD